MIADVARLRAGARDARGLVLQMARRHGAGHPGGCLSACDLLAAVLLHARRPGIDRFVLSKGHAVAAHHALLALGGAFPVAELAEAAASRPGVDFPPGPPGHGLAASVGVALAAKLAGTDARTYVLLGDGECQAGAVWEAAQVAARHGLDRLVAIVDQNRLSGAPAAGEPLEKPAARFRAFGWHVIELNGHDMDRIVAGFNEAERASGTSRPSGGREAGGAPVVIIASTVKGMGVSFMLDNPAWHSRVPDAEELRVALAELGGNVVLPGDDCAAAAARADDRAAAAPDDAFGAALAALNDPTLLFLDADRGGLPGFPAERTVSLGLAPETLPAVASGLAAAGRRPWALIDSLPSPWPAGRVKLAGPAALAAGLPAHVSVEGPADLAAAVSRLHAHPGPGFLALGAEAPPATSR